jgi:hypothetical protein
MPIQIEPLRFLAGCNTFPEWVTLFTLCLAPLIAHIIAGTPPVSYLARNRPTWIDTLCHYNPTSIIWRYAAIVDRRLRATRWCPSDLAATNAIFWTTKGWNGEESMVISAMPFQIQVSQKSHIDIFSITMLKTVIITLQGCSALYSLTGGLAGSIPTSMNVAMGSGMDVIFFPLAILGLLRLCAAAWLTEDFAYMCLDDFPHKSSQHNDSYNEDGFPLFNTADDVDPWLVIPPKAETYFRAPNSAWISCAFRTVYLLICIGIWSFALVSLIPQPGSSGLYSVTSFLTNLFYLSFLTISIFTYAIYFLRGKTTTTIIPCISSSWYKAYTILLMATILVLVIISAMETYREPNGLYTSFSTNIHMDCEKRMR